MVSRTLKIINYENQRYLEQTPKSRELTYINYMFMVFSSKIPYSSGLESELLMDAKGLFKTIVVKYLAV